MPDTLGNMQTTSFHAIRVVLAVAVFSMLAGCQSDKNAPVGAPQTTAVSVSQPASSPEKAIDLPTIRIKCGVTDGFTDSSGHAWLPDQGFADGDTVDRPDAAIENTTDPRIYRAERYGMTKFAQPLPNGKYTVKLHFCETFDGITGEGQRVFSFNVAGQEFKDFDVWKKAGGFQKAYVESVPVEITGGKLEITFTANVENPQINAIEIIPQS